MPFCERLNLCIGSVVGRFGVEILVIALAAFQCLGFIGTYMIAVAEQHVSPGFPYISDTGGKPPESCVFTFICCVSGMISLAIMYIRYQHVHQYYRSLVSRIGLTNVIALIFGILSVLGLIMVGSFQDDTVAIGHFIGATLVFGAGVVYMWLQTLISYRIYHASLTRHHGSIVIVIRLLLAMLCTVFFMTAIAFGLTATHFLHNNDNNEGGTSFWGLKDGGFSYHIVSTVTEWGLALCFTLFFITFHTEFVKIGVTVSITFRSNTPGQIQESTPLLL